MLNSYVEFIQSILPEHYMPDMIWDDACESIACNLGAIETGLRKYLGKHGAILTDTAAHEIEKCIYLAGSTKHEVSGPKIPEVASDAANNIFQNLKTAQNSLVGQVRGQSST